MALARVPLFPLNTVCFPGTRLPLRVFEPRYQEMLAELLEDGRDPVFAVACTDDPEVGVDARPARVGCLARVLQASPPGPQRLVLAEGSTRYVMHALHHERAFAEADVAILPEEEGADPDAASHALLALLEPCLEELGVPLETLPQEPCTLSYVIAQHLPFPRHEKQRLLEAADATARLAMEARLVAGIAPQARLAALARKARLN